MALSPRFREALDWAADLHRTQVRKGTTIPYVSHLLAVASLVLEHGGDEDAAIAALLHDAAEDQGGEPTLREIRRRFGDEVAAIVEHCTDTMEAKKPKWKSRKEAYIASLREKPSPSRLVSAADKLHNARAVLADYRRLGEALWTRFSGERETLWYYRALADEFSAGGPADLAAELDRTVRELERLAEDPCLV
jgi:(p)ppGpp synthase/HD superfamily hydrolase